MNHDDRAFKTLLLVGFLFWAVINSLWRRARGIQRKQSKNPGNDSFSLGDWLLSLFTLLKKRDPEAQARSAAAADRQAEIIAALRKKTLPASMQERLKGNREGTLPWIATLSPAELCIVRSHGIRPIATVSATCWMHYGWSWTKGHEQGWETALRRLREEAVAAGANAVLDVKMRTVPVDMENGMDFTLIGTAVKIADLPPSNDPIVATVPALEFVKLLEADIVPTGIAIGAEYRQIVDWRRSTSVWGGNTECVPLSDVWKHVRNQAYRHLSQQAKLQGNGALAHINFSQMFEIEVDKQPNQYLARHIVIATVVDAPQLPDWAARRWPEILAERIPDLKIVVDLHAGKTPLNGRRLHHESYGMNEQEGPI